MRFDDPRRAFKVVECEGVECVAELIVPSDTTVIYPMKPSGSWNNEHLRVESAIVGDIEADRTVAHSVIDDSFLYAEGERVVPEDFDADVAKVSAPGIHVFATRKGAEHWSDD